MQLGWIPSVRKAGNDGAVGNTLEKRLGIEENNLPIPNANEWELKGQRSNTFSLITLKHIEPSPQAAKIVPKILLPFYGWKHDKAGTRHPVTEMSFRSTTSANQYTKRGFTLVVDRNAGKLRFIFDPSKADSADENVHDWLQSVERRIGLNPLDPEPYWGFEDLKFAIGEKIKNCFYVIADSKKEKKKEYFLYRKILILSGFDFEKFLTCLEEGAVYVDFDARTGHNHGTKFRIRQNFWNRLYTDIKEA